MKAGFLIRIKVDSLLQGIRITLKAKTLIFCLKSTSLSKYHRRLKVLREVDLQANKAIKCDKTAQ